MTAQPVTTPRTPDMPDWYVAPRPWQPPAVAEIVDHFSRGTKVVILDAPTGVGKTLIAELVRRELGVRGLYVCSTRNLQSQVADPATGFGYGRVIWGRAHYPTQDYPGVMCDVCNLRGGTCSYCSHPPGCAYRVAKLEALAAELGIANTSYLLAEANTQGRFGGRPFIIADEADLLEGELMGWASVAVSKARLEKLGLLDTVPSINTRWTTRVAWVRDSLLPRVKAEAERAANTARADKGNVAKAKRASGWARLAESVKGIAGVDEDGQPILGTAWVYDPENDAGVGGGIEFKPIRVAEFGKVGLWPHGEKWLAMSATVIAPDQLAGDAGLEDDEWELVTVDSPFDPKRAPIFVLDGGDMGSRTERRDWGKMLGVMRGLAEKHRGERMLVHCQSRARAHRLARDLGGRAMGYEGRDRERKLEAWLRTSDGILCAQSFGRGVDLAGDACRVVVTMKLPWMSLGDRQVKARSWAKPDGDSWYATHMLRELVQGFGRHIRSEDDWGWGYLVDGAFKGQVWQDGRRRRRLPKWFVRRLVWGGRGKPVGAP